MQYIIVVVVVVIVVIMNMIREVAFGITCSHFPFLCTQIFISEIQ